MDGAVDEDVGAFDVEQPAEEEDGVSGVGTSGGDRLAVNDGGADDHLFGGQAISGGGGVGS